MATDNLRAGIEALQRGDRGTARELLREAASADPQNENAWYYLAAAQDDPALRRTYLERVLIINPLNEKARQVLVKLDEAEAAASSTTAAPATPPPASRSSSVGAGVRKLSEAASAKPKADSSGLGAAATTPGFALPFTIPGAPARVGLVELFRDGFALFMRGVEAIQQKPGAWDEEVRSATWWRFWLLVGWCAVVGITLTTVGTLVGSIFGLFLGRGFNPLIIIGLVLGLIVTIPINMAVLYGGVFASHWFAKEQQRSNVSQLEHAYSTAIFWSPAAVIGAALTAITGVVGLGFIGALASLALNIYALYLIGLHYRRLHTYQSENQEWFTTAVFFVAVIVLGAILGVFSGVFGTIGLLAS